MLEFRSGNTLLAVDLILSKLKLRDKMVVADFGCGTSGYFVFPIAEKIGKNGIVYAVDILKMALENIRKKARHENLFSVKAIWSDLEVFGATKIESSSVDAGLLINTLYLSDNKVNIVREVARTIKKDGELMAIEWKNTSIPFGPQSEDRITKEDLIKIAAKNSLVLKEEFSPGEYHYGLIFTKI